MAKKTGTAGNDKLVGTSAADTLFGLAGKDLLIGGAGNDYLDGGTGDDDLRGGAGNDVYILDNAGDITKPLADPGKDTVGALISYALGPQQENLTLIGTARLQGTGNNFANHLNGNDGANILIGLGGNDLLDGHKGIDDLRGGAGNDLYLIDNANEIRKTLADPGARDQVQSTVSYVLGNNQEELVLLGTKALAATGKPFDNFLLGNNAANVLHGGNGKDILDGGIGNDKLFGDAGDDTLYGGLGRDTLRGGDGNDKLYGMDGNDTVSGDAGADEIQSGSDTLNGGEGNDKLFGMDDGDTLNGDAGNDELYGGQGVDVLTGGDGDDLLDGGIGIDALHGGSGNDRYVIDNVDEIDRTALDPGDDTVFANANYTLGPNQENIRFYGTDAHAGTGNEFGNTITVGGSQSDILFGLGGNDILDGGGVPDLNGNKDNGESDQLAGGDGDDTYIVDNAGDIDSGRQDPGHDQVQSYITYTLNEKLGAQDDKQEDLVLLGTLAHNGNGNSGENLLVGNTAINILHGNDGADRVIGGGGADQLFGDGGDDTLYYEASAALIDGGTGGADSLFVTGPASETDINLDLTTVNDDILKGIENIRFDDNGETPADHTHTLSLTATDVLALSDTTDLLIVLGETGDTVHTTDSGWTADSEPSQVLTDGKTYMAYSNGGAHLLIDEHITFTAPV